jgi:predicted small lipoprotein YifL
MNRTGRILAAALPLAALLSLGLTACGRAGPAPVSPPPSSARTAAEQAAVLNWLARTNAMWTRNDFAALDEITTAEMRTIYLAEQRGASLPSNASRQPFQLNGLSITVPCQPGRPGVFVAYGDTDVFDLGPAMQPMAMVFERVDGRWKLAAAVNRPARGWPALCTNGAPPSAPPALAAADFAPELARVLTHATTGSAETTATAARRSRSTTSSPAPVRSTPRPPGRPGRTGAAGSASPRASPRPPIPRSRCRWPAAGASGWPAS